MPNDSDKDRCNADSSAQCRYSEIISEFKDDLSKNRDVLSGVDKKVTELAMSFKEFRKNLAENMESTQKRYDESIRKLTEVVLEGGAVPSLREQVRSNEGRIVSLESDKLERRVDILETAKARKSRFHEWSLTVTGWIVALLMILTQAYISKEKTHDAAGTQPDSPQAQPASRNKPAASQKNKGGSGAMPPADSKVRYAVTDSKDVL